MANKKSSGKRKSQSARSKAQRQAQREAAEFASDHKKGIIIFITVVLVILIAAALIIYLCFPDLLNRFRDEYLEYTQTLYGDGKDDDPEGTYVSAATVEAGKRENITTADFSIHFLELGNKYAGDCTLIKCGDTEVLIDAGSRTNSAATIKGYVDQFCSDGKLEYVIATHAHQDHIAGFVGNAAGSTRTGILYQYEIGTIIQFSGHNTSSGIYNSYVTAVNEAEKKGAVAYTALECWKGMGKKDTQAADDPREAKRQYDLSVAQDSSLTLNVLYNYYYEHETADENDYSVCVLLTHTAADNTKTNYLFTGDLEGKGEEYLVDNNDLPEVELFKGGHHGSKTSSTDKLLSVIKPKNVAVCCCAGSTEYTTNHDNTFPTQAFIDRISKYTDCVYCTSLCIDYKAGDFTSMNGNIVFYYDREEGEEKYSLKQWFSNNATKLRETQWFKDNRKCPSAWL